MTAPVPQRANGLVSVPSPPLAKLYEPPFSHMKFHQEQMALQLIYLNQLLRETMHIF